MTTMDTILVIVAVILLGMDVCYVGYTEAIRRRQRRQREKHERELQRKSDEEEEAHLMYTGDYDEDGKDDGIGY